MDDSAPRRLPLVASDSRDNMRRAFKASGCVVCKRRYPELDWDELHCDHLDPQTKPTGISAGRSVAARGHTSAAAALAEFLTCQVLCTDCHLEKTRNGNQNGHVGQLALFTGTGEAWRLNTNGGD
jgi:hypothetical protein